MVNKIELPEPTWEALEEFLADPMVSCFLNEDAKKVIREKSKGQLVTREEYRKLPPKKTLTTCESKDSRVQGTESRRLTDDSNLSEPEANDAQ